MKLRQNILDTCDGVFYMLQGKKKKVRIQPIMTDSAQGNKSRDHIIGLEQDIKESMAGGFPQLIFTKRLEKRYLADNLEARRKYFFVMTVIAVFMYNLFLITDREMLPDVYLTAWKIRLVIVTPAALIILFFIHGRVFMRFIDYMADFLLVLSASSIIVILELSNHPNVVHYHTGVILILMFGNIVVRLRFWHAFCVSWVTFLFYVLTVTNIAPMTPPVMINSSVVLFSAIVISLIANYQIESALRWNYLRNLLKEIETIRLEKDKEELELISSLDVLTELANRRHFDEYLDAEWRMGFQYRAPLSLLFLDVDDFKPYNDHYGHQAGDVCLQRIAAALRGCIHRSRDLCARYGGEEFVILLPNTSQETAFHIAEKVRKSIEDENIPHQFSRVTTRVTISIGVACLMPRQEVSPRFLVEMADKALYKAKELGRNQAQIFDDATTPADE